MERPSISFIVMIFVLLFTIIGFIFVVFDLRGLAFVFELALLLAFMFFLTFAMFLAYHRKSSSWAIIAAVLVLLLFDVFIIFLATRRIGASYLVTTFFALIGLLVALVNAVPAKKKSEKAEAEPQYYYPYMGEKAEQKEESKEELKQEIKEEVKSELNKEQKVTAEFTPGKFVASSKGSTFHIPKCVWAKNISKPNQVWFNSKADAIAKGYSEHKCQA